MTQWRTKYTPLLHVTFNFQTQLYFKTNTNWFEETALAPKWLRLSLTNLSNFANMRLNLTESCLNCVIKFNLFIDMF